jgi:hypothetical protein
MKVLLVMLMACLLSGCSASGTWKDDPKNWARYFKERQPSDIIVRHSYYWRSPQPVLLEFSCYFEIDDSKAARSYFGFGDAIKRTSLKISDQVDAYQLGDAQVPWFPTHSSVGDFEIWRPQDKSLYVAIVDRKRGRIFIADRM